MSFIHGDFCMGNILYDVNSKLLKFLDPRGYFGKMSIYGDIKYDIAKLRHSFCSFYDFIVADLFKIIEPAEGQYFYNVYIDDYHRLIANKFDEVLIKKGYNLKLIKYVEALLFLSMASLHSNSLSRQKAMYVTGIRLLNETFK
jgi:5-methylthioribose kinase